MKIFPKRRVANDVYSKEVMSEIAYDLDIKNTEDILLFKECLERSALDFIDSKKSNNLRDTEATENRKLKQLAKSLNKSKKLYSEITTEPQRSSFRYLDGLRTVKTNFTEIREYLFKITHDGFIIKSEGITNLLSVLEEASKEALKHPYHFGKTNKTDLVLSWLWGFSDEWSELSSVIISEGKEYQSPAMRILEKIRKPINQSLKVKDHITTSQIAEAIIKHRKLKDVKGCIQEESD